jgi:phospholipase/carboxylesterase
MGYRTIETDEAVTLTPRAAQASVIWLHGLGADGHDFVPIVPELRLPAAPAVRFVFPHAAVRPVTVNNGFRMRAWYDIKSLTPGGRGDPAGLADSVARINALIAAERADGIDAARIVVAGFSQGGAVALHVALACPQRLAGVIALSAYLPLAGELEGRLADANRDLPILQCHGRHDPMVALPMGEAARDWLTTRNYPLEWHEYPMQHEVCADEIADVARWLRARLG